jgi:hypothetical protein
MKFLILILNFIILSCATENYVKKEIPVNNNLELYKAVIFKDNLKIKYYLELAEIENTNALFMISFLSLEDELNFIKSIYTVDLNKITKKEQYRIMSEATLQANINIINKFIEMGFSPVFKDKFNRNMLHIALMKDNKELLLLAISHEIDPSIKGFKDKKVIDYDLSRDNEYLLKKYIINYKK